ncbi:MAG TPA: DUF3341 domain-containing protein [Frateuria sp.]|uniref:DUF3341 domain-containing protein n=1 Tax=Frateuria sp. TaxID=2211372 RepID=UPI002DE4636F|nr:DUF3341 domain-containing protein [Frateuria sp.]
MNERGWLARFDDAQALLLAVRELRRQGYTQLEAYTPYAVEGLAEALGPVRDRIPLLVLLGGLCGGFGTLFLEWYASVVNYPIDVGGRPDASWPAFVPAALEMTILFAALFGVVGLFLANGLPRLVHPLFAVPGFEAASRDGFFLWLRADDPRFEAAQARADLARLAPLAIDEVAP